MIRRVAQDWQGITRLARSAAVRRISTLGVKEFETQIKLEVCFEPSDWQRRFNLVRGATRGRVHNLLQMDCIRPHNRHARYRNLYFDGASTLPGTGLPKVIVSARLAAQRVLEDMHPSHH